VVTDTAQIRKDLEYYIDKVPVKKTPAMSKSIYSILYARLGNAPKALYYFYDSYLPNLNPPFRVIAEFNGGTNPYFITGAGGTLQSIIFGFAGLDITEKGLKPTRTPMLPQKWSSLTITVAGKDIVQITQ
jgi:trehalose/maltose hydrolase-like predicted phosphorylase